MCNCNDKQDAAELLFEYGDYLYPFSIEFSILIGEYNNVSVFVISELNFSCQRARRTTAHKSIATTYIRIL